MFVFLSFLFQLQKLKRSLSFRTKSLRSKSADNFFQRPSPEVSNSSSTGQLSTIGVSVSAPSESCYIPPLTPPPTMPSGLPLTICSPSRAPRPPDPTAHTFLEHTFKKPHFCDVCNHMIVGKTMLMRFYNSFVFVFLNTKLLSVDDALLTLTELSVNMTVSLHHVS